VVGDMLLRQDVLDELDFRPDIDASHIRVGVEGGVVTLTGRVATYAEKVAAVNAARALAGVLAVAEEIEVRFTGDTASRDERVAQRALDSIAWNTSIPSGAVQVAVESGWVRLSGEFPGNSRKRPPRIWCVAFAACAA